MTPIVGDAIESVIKNTVGNVVEGLVGRFLPKSMTDAEKEEFKQNARQLAIDETNAAGKDIQDARALAAKESEGGPSWAKVLTVTHRPIWSFLILAIFAWTVIAPYFNFPNIALTEIHKDIMQTVIIFYFGGRSIEKTVSVFKG